MKSKFYQYSLSFCRRLYVSLAFTLTPTSACRHMFNGPSLAALQSCISCAVYDLSSRRLSIRLVVAPVLSRLDYCMLLWLAFWHACSIISSSTWMLQLGWLLLFVAQVTDAFASYHWLRAPEHIKFKLIIIYWAVRSTAHRYLSDLLLIDLSSGSRLWSSASRLLIIHPLRLVTVSVHSFSTAGPPLWKSLPKDVQSTWSLTIVRRRLKFHLFWHSYPDIIL